MGTESPEGLIKKIAENGLGIRFGRGVVGKTSHAVTLLIVVWGLAIWKLGDSLVTNSFLIGAAILISCLFVWWTKSTQAFAERNPAQAMLDGAEFLEWRRMETEAKGLLPQPGNGDGVLIEGPKS